MSHKQSSIISPNGSEPVTYTEPEVVPKAARRTFSADYKLRIVEAAARWQTWFSEFLDPSHILERTICGPEGKMITLDQVSIPSPL